MKPKSPSHPPGKPPVLPLVFSAAILVMGSVATLFATDDRAVKASAVRAAGYRSMTCGIGGCPLGELRLQENFSYWTFEFRRDGLTDLAVFEEALQKLELIYPEERVDQARFELQKKDCSEARGKLGAFACQGKTTATFRVRSHRKWDDVNHAELFRWRTVSQELNVEIHPSPIEGDVFAYDWKFYLERDPLAASGKSAALDLKLRSCTYRSSLP